MPKIDDPPPLTWYRSLRGNPWAMLDDGQRVTLFFRRDTWRWCIAGPGGALMYSVSGFATQDEAMDDLERELDR